jgi:type II secretory pathway pseudopilin PulG
MPTRRRCESGSLPVVLLVAIVMAGAILALFATVSTGTDTARRDRDWQSAVQVADAGIQQAFVNLRDLEDDATVAPCDTNGDGTCSGTVGAGTFTFEYELAPNSETQFEVTSRGEVGDSARVLQANVGPRQVFPVAMLAKTSLTYNGAGEGNSPFSIGSFGSITLNGTQANASVESIVAYGPGPHDITAGSQQITNAANWSTEDLSDLAHEAFANDDLCGPGSGRPFYDVYPADVVTAEAQPGVRGEVYCVGRVNFSSSPTHTVSGGSTGEAVEVYVKNSGTANSLEARTHAKVNWSGTEPGAPAEYLFFVQSGPVLFNANSRFAGGIYAPNSACETNGTATLMGSIVCNDITINGNFGYGEDLSDVTEGPFAVNRYWEDPAGS